MSSFKSGSSSTTRILVSIGTPDGQHDHELGESSRLRLDRHLAAVQPDDDVVADREAEAGPLSGRLGREKRLEDLRADVVRDAVAVVADADLDGAGQQARAETDAPVGARLAVIRRVAGV